MEVFNDKNEVVQEAVKILQELLRRLEIRASVIPSTEIPAETDEGAMPTVTLDIEGEDLGILIGWHGQTLAALQHLLRIMHDTKTHVKLPVVVDVNGYKRRHYEALRALAWRMAEQVREKGTPFTLEPMSPFERRVVHLALADHPDVVTESTGFGESRKVAILPKRLGGERAIGSVEGEE